MFRLQYLNKTKAGLVVSTIALCLLLEGCSKTPPYQQADAADTRTNETVPRSSNNSNPSGFDIEGIRLTAADSMLDFRYKVSDPEKAAQLINRKIKPYLIDEASGAKIAVSTSAKLGALRHTGNNLIAGRTYFILFANPGRMVKRGTPVTITMGDHKIEHLIVE